MASSGEGVCLTYLVSGSCGLGSNCPLQHVQDDEGYGGARRNGPSHHGHRDDGLSSRHHGNWASSMNASRPVHEQQQRRGQQQQNQQQQQVGAAAERRGAAAFGNGRAAPAVPAVPATASRQPGQAFPRAAAGVENLNHGMNMNGYGSRAASSSSSSSNRGVCRFWREHGSCRKGASCDFLHVIAPAREGRDGQGRPGGFGGASATGSQPCRFFVRGFCRDGDRCRFSHARRGNDNAQRNSQAVQQRSSVGTRPPANNAVSADSNRSRDTAKSARSAAVVEVCRYFRRNGTCQDGDKCKWRHDPSDGRRSKHGAGLTDGPRCSFFNSAGGCRKGNRCSFAHLPRGAHPANGSNQTRSRPTDSSGTSAAARKKNGDHASSSATKSRTPAAAATPPACGIKRAQAVCSLGVAAAVLQSPWHAGVARLHTAAGASKRTKVRTGASSAPAPPPLNLELVGLD